MCNLGQFTGPSSYIFNRDIDSAVDGEYATKFFQMMTKSLDTFASNFEKYEEYCDKTTLEVPCEMFRYPSDTTMQEVVGTLRTITMNVIDGCIEGFGWQWISTIKGKCCRILYFFCITFRFFLFQLLYKFYNCNVNCRM